MKKYTKWIPLGTYSYGYTDYIVFVRKNLRNGMMQFKTKTAAGNFTMYKHIFIPVDLIDTEAAWKTITES